MVKSSKTPQEQGKDFEGRVQEGLQSFMSKKKTVTLRLYDTRSAGNYLPAQPGDFVTVYEGRPALIEAKSSTACESLSNDRKALTSLFDKEQIAKMRLWHRAGSSVSVIFKCHHRDLIEVWDGSYIAECFLEPRKRADIKMAYLFKSKDMPTACEFMMKGRMF